MSSISSPLNSSLVQAAQAQQVSSKSRDAQRARADKSRRFEDTLDLRVSGVESDEAVRQLPHNESEQAGEEHRGHDDTAHTDYGPEDDGPRAPLDVQA